MIRQMMVMKKGLERRRLRGADKIYLKKSRTIWIKDLFKYEFDVSLKVRSETIDSYLIQCIFVV